jgi:hypothetical protein
VPVRVAVLGCGEADGLSVAGGMGFCAGWGASGRTLLSTGAPTIVWAQTAELVKLGKINKTELDARTSFNHRRFRTNQPILIYLKIDLS